MATAPRSPAGRISKGLVRPSSASSALVPLPASRGSEGVSSSGMRAKSLSRASGGRAGPAAAVSPRGNLAKEAPPRRAASASRAGSPAAVADSSPLIVKRPGSRPSPKAKGKVVAPAPPREPPPAPAPVGASATDGAAAAPKAAAKEETTFTLHVRSVTGEEVASLCDAVGSWTYADVCKALADKTDLLPGHQYKLVYGEQVLEGKMTVGQLVSEARAAGAAKAGGAADADVELVGVVVAMEDAQEALDFALIEAADELDTPRVRRLLDAGASAAFLHDPEGTWGARDSKSALHVALGKRIRNEGEVEAARARRAAVVDLLLEAKADVNATRSKSDWRGCGSSSTAFEMALGLASEDPALPGRFLAAGANPNTRFTRSVHSMRTDGSVVSYVIHQAVSSGNEVLVRALLDAKAEVDALRTERMQNERGYDRDMAETALHVACQQGDAALAALLLAGGADVNAVRRDLEIVERAREATPPRKTKGKSKSAKAPVDDDLDDPRAPGYVPPVVGLAIRETALHVAIQGNKADLVARLVAAGADTAAARRRGEEEQSPADLCKGDPELLKALHTERAGAGPAAAVAAAPAAG